MSNNGTRYAIRNTDTEGQVWWVAILAPLTNPAWTQRASNAKTWASRSGAMANVRKYRLTEISGTLDVVEIKPESAPLAALRRAVSGRVASGEAEPIVEQRAEQPAPVDAPTSYAIANEDDFVTGIDADVLDAVLVLALDVQRAGE